VLAPSRLSFTPIMWRRAQHSWGDAQPTESLVPPCFPSLKQFTLWLELWTQKDEQKSGFCVDCTKERQLAMIANKRCSFPNTKFDRDPDTGLPRGNRQ
jgi:hypothetical protein